ncbi:unnamed protein product [Bemisia tabaci]|uniref:Solute carrier organic anion transporter family member n=1 Tax=Bemisia tabaci TaxID=7038 RepID=A0A9P0EVR3_BEMTA|nr:unnamed protein product [Bemisia tabaci]
MTTAVAAHASDGEGEGEGDGGWETQHKLLGESNGKTNGGPLPLPPLGNGTHPAHLESDDEELKCGIGGCTPGWMQVFASKQGFLVTFCITWVLQGMYNTYFVSVITTIEKLFQLQSKTIGFIMSATEIGQISSSLLLTYYVGQGHRPRWIAMGMVLFAICSFTCSLPHFIFGRQLLDVSEPFADVNKTNSMASLCPDPRFPPILTASSGAEQCEDKDYQAEQRAQSDITNIILVVFFVSLLGVGMGQTPVYTLGIPYIDDNVASRESPLYFSITIGVRILGPAMGFILGSLTTRLYVDLSVDPGITPKDPRWVGAWWLGLVLVSTLLLLFSPAMFSFPKRLNGSRPVAPEIKKDPDERGNPSLRDFPKAIKRLLRNDILMFRTASSVLHLLPIAGLYTFLPKYFESQFRLTAHDAAMVSGIGGILVMGIGIIISGVFILRVKPNARFVAGWIALAAAIYACGMVILMFVGCPMDDFAGLTEGDKLPRFTPQCDTPCACDEGKFNPVCGMDGRTYYSPCFAGCHNSTVVDGKVVEFKDCTCIKSSNNSMESFTVASPGYCHSDCGNFKWYIILFSLFVFVHSTSEVGSMLLILRCVDPRDKAMALGLIQFAIGLFGNVPCPVVYGAVVDSACLVWDMACGKKGACSLYDAKVFRRFYHGTTGGIMLLAFFVDLIVWFKAGSINFADEQTPAPEELSPINEKPEKSETSV